MNPTVYLIKINVAITVCYLAYMLLFRKDACLRGKRVLLLSIMAFSLIYPFVTLFQSMFNSLFAGGLTVSYYSAIYLNEAAVKANTEGQTARATLLYFLPTIIYCAGVAAMLIRMLMQIVSLICQIYTAERSFVGDTKIYKRSGLRTPFSFFNHIVLDPTRYDRDELSEIIQHETTHCRQWHTIDLLASELLCVVCWFNPFVWLLCRETRLNLEYIADRSVLEAGCNREHYQYHLLRLTYNKAIATITNNFNVSHLKQRIIMINKRTKSDKFGAKYLLFLPLAASLLYMNNIKADNVAVINAASIVVPTVTVETQSAAKGDSVYTDVEQMAVFPGGDAGLIKWIGDHLVYPKKAMEKNIEGRVSIRFVVKADGTIGDAEVIRAVDPELDKEALRLVRALPKFQPAIHKGEKVAVYYHVPIRFRLN